MGTPGPLKPAGPGFAEAFAQGREAMDRGQWRIAIGHLERAVRTRPAPAASVRLHGYPPVTGYYPYTLLARCHLELGETVAAAALLRLGEARGEPATVREPVERRLAPSGVPARPLTTAHPVVHERPPRPFPFGLWTVLAAAVLAAVLAWLGWRRRRPGGSDPAPVAGPETVGPYRIERLLGHGGFATTYLARHRDTGREVALKVLHPHRLHDPEFRRRFRQEARLGALLDHPGLAPVLDPGTEDSPGWIALEYIPGPTLAERLHGQAGLPLAEAVAIALAIAEAVAYAHAHGVVHRDLKPANVILGPAGPKVMDLGIARELDGAGATTTGAFLGTPVYAAPEVQMMARAGPAADRYSLGVMLFEMLAGQPPFQGETPFATLELHRSAPVPDLRTFREVPDGLGRLVQRLLEKDPEHRPEDGELVARLRSCSTLLAGGPGMAAGA